MTRPCDFCGADLDEAGKRPDARFCDSACRASWHRREGERTDLVRQAFRTLASRPRERIWIRPRTPKR